MSDNSTNSNNLARIRDNQRRSRARRKEYLHELEGRFRNCEQLGAEVSAEIQAAARRVLEENIRLRALLRQKGVSDEEIDGYTDHQQNSVPYPLAGASLEMMLVTGRPCRGEALSGSGSTTQNQNAPPTLQSLDVPMQRSGNLQVVVDTESASLYPTSSSRTHTPSTALVMPENPAIIQLAPDATATLHDGQVLSQAQGQLCSQAMTHTVPREEAWAPPTMQNTQSSDVDFGSTSSCFYAASIVRSMESNIGAELEADLGCSNPDADCKVHNSVVFDVMEKYST